MALKEALMNFTEVPSFIPKMKSPRVNNLPVKNPHKMMFNKT
jgi:hypothetical protein